jgi:hypothetical protein
MRVLARRETAVGGEVAGAAAVVVAVAVEDLLAPRSPSPRMRSLLSLLQLRGQSIDDACTREKQSYLPCRYLDTQSLFHIVQLLLSRGVDA